jgi:hypothetical protein
MSNKNSVQAATAVLHPDNAMPHPGAPFVIAWTGLQTFAFSIEAALWQSTVSLLVAFTLVRMVLFKFTKLPETAYFSTSFLAELAMRWQGLLILGCVGWFVWSSWSKLRWTELDPSRTLQAFVGVIGGTLAWTFSVYDFNFYYGQSHLLERVLLVTLLLGSLWRPVLIAPFLALVYLITHQFDQPIACTWTDKRVLFDVLSLFVGFLLVRLWNPRNWPTIKATDFFFLVICLQASNYFIPGLGKLLSGWPMIERLDNLFVASYLNGWLGFLNESDALGWAKLIAAWNPLMVWGSLLLELAGVFCLFNRRWCVVFLLACVGLHAMICLTTGILFWKWVVLDLSLAAVLAFASPTLTGELFSKSRFWMSIGIIAGSHFLFAPPWLAWYDTELNEQYHLEVLTTSGETFRVPRTLMVPYEVYFAQNKFHFLTRDKYVNGRYGTTSEWNVARRLDGQPSREMAEAVREELGAVEYSEQKIAAFDRFIQNYFKNLNLARPHIVMPTFLQPPQHIYSVVSEPRYAFQDNVELVRVIHERSLYQRDRIETLKRKVVREIAIPRIASAAEWRASRNQ